MSVVKNLEAMINLEKNLKAQYETQISTLTSSQEALQAKVEEQKKTIADLTAGSVDAKRLEQLNRELTNRAEKLQAEVDAQKSRAKSIQKDLNDARQQVKTLEQYDAEKLKKNLVATKQTLSEQRDANVLLTKTANKTKAENVELQAKLKELEAELAKLKPVVVEEDVEGLEVEAMAEENKIEQAA